MSTDILKGEHYNLMFDGTTENLFLKKISLRSICNVSEGRQ